MEQSQQHNVEPTDTSIIQEQADPVEAPIPSLAEEQANTIRKTVEAEKQAIVEQQLGESDTSITDVKEEEEESEEEGSGGVPDWLQTAVENAADWDKNPNVISDSLRLKKAIDNGLQKTLHSAITFPDFAKDLATYDKTGEMTPWNPKFIKKPEELGGAEGLVSNAVHYMSLIIPATAAASTVLPTTVAGGIVAGIGGSIFGVALSSNSRTDENLTTSIFREVPGLDFSSTGLPIVENVKVDFRKSPLYINEEDHPAVKWFKHIFEDLGLEVAFLGLGKAGKLAWKSWLKGGKSEVTQLTFKEVLDGLPKTQEGRIVKGLIKGSENREKQIAEAAAEQLELPGFGAYKNADLKQNIQGTVREQGKAFDILADATRKDPDNLFQATDSVITPSQAKRLANSPQGLDSKYLKEKAKELLGDARFNKLLTEAKVNSKTFKEFFEPAFERYQDLMGRNTSNMTAKQFWDPLLKSSKNRAGGMTAEDVLVADLINSSLFDEIRTKSNNAKLLAGVRDIFSKDGPMESIADRLIVGISNVKRAKILANSGEIKPAELAKRLSELKEETTDGVKLMMHLMKDSDSDDLAHAVLDVWSSSNKIRNWTDFDKWMRQKISGGEFDGRVRTGVLIKELQQVMINSMLLGAKTPQRAIWGTGFNTYLDQTNTTIGAAIRFALGKTDNTANLQSNIAALHGLIEVIPDAFKVFKKRLDVNFDKNIATVKSRFSHYSTKEHNWEMYGKWTDERGTDGDKVAFWIADIGHKLNIDRILSGVPRILRANDETWEFILAKSDAKRKAMLEVLSKQDVDTFPVINKKVLSEAQDKFYNQYLDEEGNLDISKDIFLKQRHQEVTLTESMDRYGETFQRLFDTLPALKPFYFFMRTGVNSLKVNTRNQPILAAMLKQQRQIAFGTVDDVAAGNLQKWGITNTEELEQAKALLWGRQAVGLGLVSIGVTKYLHNGLNGNGPQNRAMRKMWEDTGWERGRIEIAGKMVDLNLFEPWSIMFKAIADVGDNAGLMGDAWVEDRLSAIAWAVAGGATSNTFLQGANQMVDILSAQPGSRNMTISNIFNNQVPAANLRNTIGKTLNPGLLEIDNNIWDSIRRRNALTEHIAAEPLAFKYSILDGEKLKDYHPLTRMLNDWTIFNFTPKNDAGERFLHNSNYDMRMSVLSTPSLGSSVPALSLENHARLRSEFGRHIGETRINNLSLRDRLNILANDPKIKASIKAMKEDQRNGNHGYDAMKTYYHNDKIEIEFDRYRKKGWSKMIQQMRAGKYPELENLLNENLELTKQMRRRRYETQQEPTPIPLHLGR